MGGLGRVRERGLPLVVVVNRLPAEGDDRREVLDDVERLLAEAGLAGQGSDGEAAELPLEVVGVTEGEIEPAREALGRRGGRAGHGPDRRTCARTATPGSNWPPAR